MGYRWYDKHDIEPAFPFGFGLSYNAAPSAYTASTLVSGRTVSFQVIPPLFVFFFLFLVVVVNLLFYFSFIFFGSTIKNVFPSPFHR